MGDVNWKEVKGKKILYFDARKMPGEDLSGLKVMLAKAREMIDAQPRGSVLILTDLRDTGFTSESNSLMKDFSGANTPFVKASAVVGATGLRKMVIISIRTFTGRDIQTFDTSEEAEEWLVSR